MSADDVDRDRLASECAALAHDFAELRELAMELRELLAMKERELGRAARAIEDLRAERDALARQVEGGRVERSGVTVSGGDGGDAGTSLDIALCLDVVAAAMAVRDAESRREGRPPLEDALRALEHALDGVQVEDVRRHARESGRLVLGVEAGGRRHFLAGRAVHAGMPLELRTIDGAWIAGRYEWSFAEGDPPKLCGMIAGVEIALPPDAVLRWPAPREREEGALG